MRDNDIKNDEIDFTVHTIFIGKMVKADKDTFKRVYRDDGTYYYPIMLENQLRKKGELYFKSCELTISYDRTGKIQRCCSSVCIQERSYQILKIIMLIFLKVVAFN